MWFESHLKNCVIYSILKDTLITDPPLIDPKYLSHPDDIRTIVKAIEIIIELIEDTPELKEYGMNLPIGNDFNFKSLLNFVQQMALSKNCFANRILVSKNHEKNS